MVIGQRSFSIPECRNSAPPNVAGTFRRAHQPPWMSEVYGPPSQRRGRKSKKVKLSMWEHEFVCLADCHQVVPPSPMEKAELIRAGLGPKKLNLLDFGEPWEFHGDVMAAFPKLAEGGGYELMRTQQGNNRELCVIPSQSGGYTEYIKNIVSSAKIYIRPIQKNLSLSALVNEDVITVR